jgi:hypothetical protein
MTQLSTLVSQKTTTSQAKGARGPNEDAGAESPEIASAGANLLSESTQIAIFSKVIRRSGPARIARIHARICQWRNDIFACMAK